MKKIDEINEKTLSQTKKVLDELTKNYEEFSIGYYKHKEKYKNSPVVVIEQEILEELIEENAQLKELLKECSPYVSRSATSRTTKNSVGFKKDMKLLTKIDEVLNGNTSKN